MKRSRHAFREFDTDLSGTLDFKEFYALLLHLDLHLLVPQAKKYFRMCDTDSSGFLDKYEFDISLFMVEWIMSKRGLIISPADAFSCFDVDGGGELDYYEFSESLRFLGMTTDEKQLRKLFVAADEDESGMVDYEEFKQIWSRCRPARYGFAYAAGSPPQVRTRACLGG